jgi:hypothetical protein
MEPLTVIAGISALVDIYLKLTRDTVKAEHNPELPCGHSKHKYVEQDAVRAINGLDLPEELKADALTKVSPAIKEAVKFNNENGVFASEPNKTDEYEI